MDSLNKYREAVEKVLNDVAHLPTVSPDLEHKTLFDSKSDNYAVLELGWDKARRMHALIAHVEIINGKVWVQEDNTDLAIAEELADAGIPENDIVIGFHPPNVRPFTNYATA